MPAPPIVNDLTIEAATVNGYGSQSANFVIAKGIVQMGIPVAPKNVRSHLLLRKVAIDHDVRDAPAALRLLHESRDRGELLTGLLYVNTAAGDLWARERLSETPLASLGEPDLRMDAENWTGFMAEFA